MSESQSSVTSLGGHELASRVSTASSDELASLRQLCEQDMANASTVAAVMGEMLMHLDHVEDIEHMNRANEAYAAQMAAFAERKRVDDAAAKSLAELRARDPEAAQAAVVQMRDEALAELRGVHELLHCMEPSRALAEFILRSPYHILPLDPLPPSSASASSTSAVQKTLSHLGLTMSKYGDRADFCLRCECMRKARETTFPLTAGTFVVTADLPRPKGRFMRIEFHEKAPTDNGPIVLIQAVKCMAGADDCSTDVRDRDSKLFNHWMIDSPVEADERLPAFGLVSAQVQTFSGRWQSASPHKDSASGQVGTLTSCAAIFDQPGREKKPLVRAFHHLFEVAAVKLSFNNGTVRGRVLGSLTWGYTVDGEVNESDGQTAKEGISDNFRNAVDAWNGTPSVNKRKIPRLVP